jgi:hypothetical protein
MNPTFGFDMPSNPNPTDFTGSAPFHIELPETTSPRFIDVRTAEPIMISGLRILTPKDQNLQKFRLSYSKDFLLAYENIEMMKLVDGVDEVLFKTKV